MRVFLLIFAVLTLAPLVRADEEAERKIKAAKRKIAELRHKAEELKEIELSVSVLSPPRSKTTKTAPMLHKSKWCALWLPSWKISRLSVALPSRQIRPY